MKKEIFLFVALAVGAIISYVVCKAYHDDVCSVIDDSDDEWEKAEAEFNAKLDEEFKDE